MNHFLSAFIAFVAFIPATAFGDAPLPSGHSTVHIVFVTPLPQQMAGGFMGDGKPRARIGDLIVPADAIQPIRITIDGDFVGHAMVGMQDIKPIFVLPQGSRKFTFTIDGFAPIEAGITVLGTGSKQYLIVNLPSEQKPVEAAGDAVDASTTQPFGS